MRHLAWLMLMGGLGGLISLLIYAASSSALGIWLARTADIVVPPSSQQVSQALLHMLCGMGLALMFWLSWGFAAIVDVAWWARGLSFGGVCWTVLMLPCLIGTALMRPIAPLAWTLDVARWLSTCLVSALASAWGWERIF